MNRPFTRGTDSDGGINNVAQPSAPASIGSTSSGLIDRIKAHDQEAWRRFVYLYGPLVIVWLQRAKLQPADAHDVAQEVFQAVARGMAQFRRTKTTDTFRGWLRSVVRSKVADHFRRANKQIAAAGGSDMLLTLNEVPAPGENHLQDSAALEAREEAEALQQLRLRALELISADFEPRVWDMFWRVAVRRRALPKWPGC